MLESNIKNMCVVPLVSPSVSIEHLERCIWSVETQDPVPFDFDIVIVVNSLDEDYSKQIQNRFGDEYDVFITESNGKSGMGHNARYDVYREIYKEREFTHVMPIDGDDYYYPVAFQCVNELEKKSRFDFLSGSCPFVDTIRPAPPNDGRPKIEIGDGTFLWSFLHHRTPVTPSIYWNGDVCPGGEPPLCLSNKAIDCNFRYLDSVGLADDYPHLCQAIIAYLNGDINFVGTDCNDIYVYDCLDDGSSSRKSQDLDPEKGWPFDRAGELEKEIKKQKYHILEGVTRQDLPYATLSQVWSESEKKQYILENAL
jgi:hypothetical protein